MTKISKLSNINRGSFLAFTSIMSFLFVSLARAAESTTTDSGIAGTFGVDWMKFAAQLLNFAVVLFVLWKWVFTPVTKKLEERTAIIEKAMKDANSTEKEKQEFAIWKQQEIAKARQEAGAVITLAQVEANKVKDEILIKSKEEQQKLVEQAKTKILDEQHKAIAAAKGELADLVTTATEKILRQKLDGKMDADLIKESLANIL